MREPDAATVANRLKDEARGDWNAALSRAQEIEEATTEAEAYWFARAVRQICHIRACAELDAQSDREDEPTAEPCLLCGGRGFVSEPHHGPEPGWPMHYDHHQCPACDGAKHVPAGTQADFWESEDE